MGSRIVPATPGPYAPVLGRGEHRILHRFRDRMGALLHQVDAPDVWCAWNTDMIPWTGQFFFLIVRHRTLCVDGHRGIPNYSFSCWGVPTVAQNYHYGSPPEGFQRFGGVSWNASGSVSSRNFEDSMRHRSCGLFSQDPAFLGVHIGLP